LRHADRIQRSNGSSSNHSALVQILKLVRRQMYGRGKINLLQARLIAAE
jgi:transposase